MNIKSKIEVNIPKEISNETAAQLLRKLADKMVGEVNGDKRPYRKRKVYHSPKIGTVMDYEGNGVAAFLKTPWGWMAVNGGRGGKVVTEDRAAALETGVPFGKSYPCEKLGSLAKLLNTYGKKHC